MPLNLTDTSSFDDPIVVPTSGDARTSYGLRTALQGLANRTRYLKNLRGAASGVASLDSSSKVIERAAGALVLEDIVEDTFLGTDVDVATWVDVTGSTLSFTALAGDNLVVEAEAYIQSTGSGTAQARIFIHEAGGGGIDTTQIMGSSIVVGNTQTRVPMKSFKKGLAAGTVTVKLQLTNPAAAPHAKMTEFFVNIRQTRP